MPWVVLLAACEPALSSPMVLGGVEVDARTLEEGREVYTLTCAACHGDAGDGRGPAAPSLTVPPRDFTAGTFKYAGVAAGELPRDEDLLRTVRRGLTGTPMLAWDLTDAERRAVVQYVKTFSPRWRETVPGAPIRKTPDPFRGRDEEALPRGEALYHVTAGCADCHGAYAPRARLRAITASLGQPDRLPPNPYVRPPRDSEFFAGAEPVRIVPTDFLEDPIKSGASAADLYRTIASGVGGTAMPQWKGSLPEEDLWALVHYVKHLVDLRGTEEGDRLRSRLR